MNKKSPPKAPDPIKGKIVRLGSKTFTFIDNIPEGGNLKMDTKRAKQFVQIFRVPLMEWLERKASTDNEES